jgi:hypothetical protein
MVKFIEIKQNSDKNFNNLIQEKITQLALKDELYVWDDDISDFIDELKSNDLINMIDCDAIQYIESYFSHLTNTENTDETLQVSSYEIIIIDKVDIETTIPKYNLMLIDKNLNSSSNVLSMTELKRKQKFNLIASEMSKYTTNSNIIFGDVFILQISATYYDNALLCQLLQKEVITNIESNITYFDYDFLNIIKSLINVNFVKIYEKTVDKIIPYSRNILESFIKSYKHDIILHDDILELNYENKIIFIKTTAFLPNSHSHIQQMIGSNVAINSSDSIFATDTRSDKFQTLNKYYLYNLTNDEIKNLR